MKILVDKQGLERTEQRLLRQLEQQDLACEAVESLASLYQLSGKPVPATLVSKAKEYSRKGIYEAVELLLKKAIALESKHGEAYAHLARLYYLVGNWEYFRPAIKRAIELNPDHYVACYYYGQLLLLDEGEVGEDRAMEFFRKSIRQEDSFAAGHIAIGQILARQQRWGEALTFYKKALEQSPELGRVYALMAQAYRALNRLEEATNSLRRYQELSDLPEQ